MAAENATAMSPPKACDAGLLETNRMTVNTTAIPSEAISAGHSAACELQLNATVRVLNAPRKMKPGVRWLGSGESAEEIGSGVVIVLSPFGRDREIEASCRAVTTRTGWSASAVESDHAAAWASNPPPQQSSETGIRPSRMPRPRPPRHRRSLRAGTSAGHPPQ